MSIALFLFRLKIACHIPVEALCFHRHHIQHCFYTFIRKCTDIIETGAITLCWCNRTCDQQVFSLFWYSSSQKG